VVLTSNRTRELHDALKRRCLYHWIDYPDFERELEIVHARLPGIAQGIAEALDWTNALAALGARELDPDLAAATLGAVLKYREDTDRVHSMARGALFGG